MPSSLSGQSTRGGANYKVAWRGREVADRVSRSADSGMAVVAIRAAFRAKEIVHVVTGRLKKSIRVDELIEGGRKRYVVGAHTPYAIYEELRPGHAYLLPALDELKGQAAGVIAAAVQKSRGGKAVWEPGTEAM